MSLIVSKKWQIALYILYGFVLTSFTVYSYALMDPNITFFNHPAWTAFREVMVQIGYHQRMTSWWIYLTLVLLLFGFHIIFVKNSKDWHPFKLSLLIGALLMLAYPLLSHDLFNYMFDAKIFTVYGENPYMKKALDFPQDEWLRFMHWTHREYAYGPTYLPLSFIPSYLSFGKFILNFFFFKLLNVSLYVAAVWCLQKLNKKWAMIFATHPLVLIEGIIVGHNDLVHVALTIIGIYFVMQKKEVWGRIFLVFSAGIKYITLPFVIITRNNWWKSNYAVLAGQLTVLIVVCILKGLQPWYFLVFFAFLPFYEPLVSRLNIFFLGILLCYYPYIALGGWGVDWYVDMKDNIILISMGLNMLYLLFYGFQFYQRRKKNEKILA